MFSSNPEKAKKQCNIIYGPGHEEEHCADLSLTRLSEGRNRNLDPSTVVIDHLQLQNESQFCSVVTASDGRTTVSVEKIFNADTFSHNCIVSTNKLSIKSQITQDAIHSN